jgi:hypothetical protein
MGGRRLGAVEERFTMQLRKWRAAVAVVPVVFALAAAPAPAFARSAGAEAGLGITCVFGNLIYGPGKMMYAMFGGFIGLVAYGLSAGDEDVAMRIIEPAWRGDYAITLEHLDGKRELAFIGRRQQHAAARDGSDGDADGDGDGGGGDGGESGWE